MVPERLFLVLTGMPRPVLGESCTLSIKYFAIFPPHQKKNPNTHIPFLTIHQIIPIRITTLTPLIP